MMQSKESVLFESIIAIEDSQLAPSFRVLLLGVSWSDSGGLWCEAGPLELRAKRATQRTSLRFPVKREI